MVAQSVSMNDNLLAMLQDFRPGDPVMRGPMASELLMRRASHHHQQQHHHNTSEAQSPDVDEVCGPSGSSPKLRLKLNRLWGSSKPPRTNSSSAAATSSNANDEQTCTSPVVSADVEERHRRRAFAHYDCQSLTANLGYAAKLRGILLARRRNTATGASAASSLRASTPDEAPEEDAGDGKGEYSYINLKKKLYKLYDVYSCNSQQWLLLQVTSSSNRVPSSATKLEARANARWA